MIELTKQEKDAVKKSIENLLKSKDEYLIISCKKGKKGLCDYSILSNLDTMNIIGALELAKQTIMNEESFNREQDRLKNKSTTPMVR